MTCWTELNGSVLVHCPPFTACDFINKRCIPLNWLNISYPVWLLILFGILFLIGLIIVLIPNIDKWFNWNKT